MLKHTGPGKYYITTEQPHGVVRAWLYNFDVDGAFPKQQHKDLLKATVAPLLREGGSIKLLGLASTTGQSSFDRQLGERRLHEVESFLRAECGARFFVAKEVSFGKQMALAFGQAHIKGGTGDNQESPLWRLSSLMLGTEMYRRRRPPRIDLPFDDPSWEEDFGKAVDSANIALGILDLIADLAEIAALAKFTGPLGLVGSIISAIISMPLIFATEP